MKMVFEDIGKGSPVVLIHAFPLSREMWELQTRELARHGFRVILPDLPGFGENNSDKRFSIPEIANQVAEMLESLKIDKAIVGGLSMGGYVAFELFRLIPEKLAALILCDTTYLADTDEKRNSRFSLISKVEKHGSQALIENMLPNLISEQTKHNNPSLYAELQETFTKVNPDSIINALHSLAERNDSSDVIRQISVPTLLIFGEFDKVTGLENGREMNQIINGSELVVIENAGHFSNLEQPEKFNAALLNFCKRIHFNARHKRKNHY